MEKKELQNIKNRYGIVGNDEGLIRALEIAMITAPTDLSVLIIGESGVGKEVIPRIIHEHSVRKHNKYFAINCGSIPEGTIDSELFGHAKGAFTGAIGEREGYFGAADNGTLFLDEVGELPLATQARLLRVLENGEYIRVGENTVRKTNVRIIAATNVNMQKAISEGKFRQDLFFRLDQMRIKMPPLRDRNGDIELLFRKFAFDIAQEYRFDPIRLTEAGKDLLQKYNWPGNIRQLRNLVMQLSVICEDRLISDDILKNFGITDDSIVGSSIILKDAQSSIKDDSASIHQYAQEREQLWNSIKALADQITELREAIFAMHSTYPQAHISLPPTQTMQVTKMDDMETMREYNEDEMMNDGTSLSIRDTEKRNIIKALERNRNNRRKAAKELGISERTLYRKLKEFNLETNM